MTCFCLAFFEIENIYSAKLMWHFSRIFKKKSACHAPMFKTADSVAISGLVKIFSRGRKTVKALDNVSFSIRKGEIFGLLGPNGAGKTTLISVLCGLLEKNAGRVEILGKNVDRDMSGIQKRINLVLGFTGIGMSLTVYQLLK